MPKLWSNDRFVTISENVRLRLRDKLIYALVIFFSLGGLIFPVLPFESQATISHPGCLFKLVTTLPCPSCGYTRSVNLMMQQEWRESLLFNPFSAFYVLLMISMLVLASSSLWKSQHYNFSKGTIIAIFFVIIISWVVKFAIGPTYY